MFFPSVLGLILDLRKAAKEAGFKDPTDKLKAAYSKAVKDAKANQAASVPAENTSAKACPDSKPKSKKAKTS